MSPAIYSIAMSRVNSKLKQQAQKQEAEMHIATVESMSDAERLMRYPETTMDGEEITKMQSSTTDFMKDNANLMQTEILFLSYMFQEDDGVISSSEKKALKKHYSSSKKVVLASDLEQLKELDNIGNNLPAITYYIKEKGFKQSTILKAIDTLKEISKGKDRYSNIIENIKSAFVIYD